MAFKILLCIAAGVAIGIGYVAWKFTARSAYESAEYTVLEADGPFEVRRYPDLMLAATGMRFQSQGDDDSFMRLFRYIGGANDRKQKIAMTTPVFMEEAADGAEGEMGFVLPATVAERAVPAPTHEQVRIRKRAGGRFAVVRFAGRVDRESFARGESRLRHWMNDRGLTAAGAAELAGYDPPWTPGPLRRNEILIRVK